MDRCWLNTVIRERLAELEHEQWMYWAKNILKTEKISEERKRRWKQYFCDYKDLPEDIKDQDRIWADKVLEILEKHLAKQDVSRR